jgi:hypothetical protein
LHRLGDYREVEQDDIRTLFLSLDIRGIQVSLCKGVNFSMQINQGSAWPVTYLHLKILCWHDLLLKALCEKAEMKLSRCGRGRHSFPIADSQTYFSLFTRPSHLLVPY